MLGWELMGEAALARHEQLAKEELEMKVRNPDGETLDYAVRQVQLERMTVPGRPKQRVLFSLFRQQDCNDTNVLVNVIKATLKLIVRAPKYYIYRFKRMVFAVRSIARAWRNSRRRFAFRIMKLVDKWVAEEEVAKKRQSNPAKRRDGTLNYLALEAPRHLKVKVFLTEFRRRQLEFLARWNIWFKNKKEYCAKVSTYIRQNFHCCDQLIAALEPPPPEPTFRWHSALAALTHEERFQMAMKLQKGDSVNKLASELPSSPDEAAIIEQFIAKHGVAEDKWVNLLMDVVALFKPVALEKKVKFQHKDKFSHVPSKIQQHVAGAQEQQQRRNETEQNSLNLTKATTSGENREEKRQQKLKLKGGMEELRNSLPTLSRFKGDPWHMPPRPRNGEYEARSKMRGSNPPSIQKLDPMAQSLAKFGIFTPPILKASKKMRNITEKRAQSMLDVEKELRTFPTANTTVDRVLKSDRTMKLTISQLKLPMN